MKNAPIWHRFGYALSGLRSAWESEKSVRTHGYAIAAGVALLLFLNPRPYWWALFLLAFSTMLAIELINTAVEKLADHLHPDQHPAIKTVKDSLAAAVLVVCTGVGLAFMVFLVQRYT